MTGDGCSIALRTRLERFEVWADQRITLRLVSPTGPRSLDAKHLILAMPRRSLELLAPSPVFVLQGDPALKNLVETVTPYPAFKLFLFYERRWWEQWGIQHGRSVCDLPIRQTYYFPPDSGAESQPLWSLLMAAYDDAHAVDFWRGLILTRDERESERVGLRAAMAQFIAQAGLARVADPQTDISDPEVGAFADWGFDPFGGGGNFWAPRSRSAMSCGVSRSR